MRLAIVGAGVSGLVCTHLLRERHELALFEYVYATLRRWRENCLAAAGEAERLGAERSFQRLFELYFAWSEGGFIESASSSPFTIPA